MTTPVPSSSSGSAPASVPPPSLFSFLVSPLVLLPAGQRTSHYYLAGVCSELGASTEVVFRTKLVWMLALGPVAVLADFSGIVSETFCFCLAGLALIPCAERCVHVGIHLKKKRLTRYYTVLFLPLTHFVS
eukprot:scaffold8828_cov204-Amphora_coffeaeformis.AAC.36